MPAKDWAAPLRCCSLAHQSPGTKSPGPRGRGRWGQRDSRGGLPWESRAFFHSNSFEIARAREDFASLFQRGCPPVVCSSCSPSQCPRASLGWLPANGQFAVEKSPRGFLLLPKTTSSYLSKWGPFSQRALAILCSLLGTHTHNRGALLSRTQLHECRGRSPGPRCVCKLSFRRVQGSFLAG